jgi:hypothetical protein
MEELAGITFWGGMVAAAGPPAFQGLFKLLQPALWHYMYNVNASPEDSERVATSLRKYAERLEDLVLLQQVSSHIGST